MANTAGLTPLQERFCQEYLVDLNGTQAYKRAGYKAKNDNVAGASAFDLLKIPKIQARLKEVRDSIQERTEVTQDWVINRLRKEAEREGEGSSHSARVRAIELLGNTIGMFADSKPPAPPTTVNVNILGQLTHEQLASYREITAALRGQSPSADAHLGADRGGVVQALPGSLHQDVLPDPGGDA